MDKENKVEFNIGSFEMFNDNNQRTKLTKQSYKDLRRTIDTIDRNTQAGSITENNGTF